MSDTVSLGEKLQALYQVVAYRPVFTTGIICLSIVAAIFEGIGLGFLLPIIEIARGTSGSEDPGRFVEFFRETYAVLGVPFTLETVILGVGAIMSLRYTMSFLVSWLSGCLRTNFIAEIRQRGFKRALNAEVGYYDTQGSDEILNAIITESRYAGRTIKFLVKLVQQGFLSLMYAAIAVYLAPIMTIAAGTLLVVVTIIVRFGFESGYAVGNRSAEANERIQQSVQAGTQGIRDVKLFGIGPELYGRFMDAIDDYTKSHITLRRNQSAIDNIYQFATAMTVFLIIYVAIMWANLSLEALGVFLFAMFRLAPRLSTLNNILYQIDGDLPHLIRTDEFLTELAEHEEPDTGDAGPVPEIVESVSFKDVEFAYGDEPVLQGVSFSVDRDEFVAFVGPSGAGKSTIVSLLARFYDPDDGTITANGMPIDEFDLASWRSRTSVVRQHPHIFNDTLRYNVTIGNREASDTKVREACEIACVTEFLDDLPRGFDTELGDDGVRLSGGQRQRIAIARALLKPADYILLDEATSDLDTTLEKEVHAGIEQMSRSRGLIVVAHRLSTVIEADRIYAMRDGRIVEVGDHKELITNDHLYAELYATQS